MRKAFSVTSLDSMVVVDSKAKRHVYKGVFERSAMDKFLKSFTSDSDDADKDVREGLESEYFNTQSYSEAAGQFLNILLSCFSLGGCCPPRPHLCTSMYTYLYKGTFCTSMHAYLYIKGAFVTVTLLLRRCPL